MIHTAPHGSILGTYFPVGDNNVEACEGLLKCNQDIVCVICYYFRGVFILITFQEANVLLAPLKKYGLYRYIRNTVSVIPVCFDVDPCTLRYEDPELTGCFYNFFLLLILDTYSGGTSFVNSHPQQLSSLSISCCRVC